MFANLKSSSSISIVAISLLLTDGCVSNHAPTETHKPGDNRHIAGTIAMVNNDYGYILVDCIMPPVAETRADIYRGRNKVGEARFSDKSKSPYAIADILNGKPIKDDIVVYTP